MASSSCILQKLIPGFVILVTFSSFSALSGCGALSILITALVLIISTIIFTYAKRKNQEATVQEEEEERVVSQSSTNEQQQQQDSPEQQYSPLVKEVSEEERVKPESTSTMFQEKAVEQQGVGVRAQIQQDLYSESESIDDQSFSTDQDSDIDWPHSGNLLGQSPECSDDSISDEESLIEIALPSGHYVGPKEDDPNKFSLHQKFQDFSTEKTIFQLFAEINDMNEEENLIEIDLSMGSIKCSRFEIEA